MGEPQVTEAPPTDEELSAAQREYRERIIRHFETNFRTGKYKLAEAVQRAGLTAIRSAFGFESVLNNVVKLCEDIAAAQISKHLAQIAQDPNSYKAFCRLCGRHYRYHNCNTGDCPTTPFADDAAA